MCAVRAYIIMMHEKSIRKGIQKMNSRIHSHTRTPYTRYGQGSLSGRYMASEIVHLNNHDYTLNHLQHSVHR
jgi:hypothetical protein